MLFAGASEPKRAKMIGGICGDCQVQLPQNHVICASCAAKKRCVQCNRRMRLIQFADNK